jgi:dTMP kinase
VGSGWSLFRWELGPRLGRYLVNERLERMKKGMYVVFEGIDGSGKTTLLREVAEVLVAKGDVVYHIPGYVVPELKTLLIKEMHQPEPDQRYLALLFAADRAKQTELIKELQYKQDMIVMASRSFISGLIYQSIQGDLAITWLENVNRFCIEPDKIIYCDLSVDEALKRIALRGEADSFEKREILEKAKTQYELLLAKYGGRVLVVNTEKSMERNVKKIVEFLEQ